MHVEIWSDIACPWCHVGKRHFETAMADFEHRDEVTVTWRSFELDPGAPSQREGDYHALLARKYGTSPERGQEMCDQMTATAAEAGLDFRFDRARPANMLDAHRLVHLAAGHGLQDAAKERFLVAYLTEGEVLSDHATLRRLAGEIGLPEDEVAETLATDRFTTEVRADEEQAYEFGIAAVPCFVVDRKFAAQGAQPPDVLLGLLRRAWDARSPLEMVADGAACGPDGC